MQHVHTHGVACCITLSRSRTLSSDSRYDGRRPLNIALASAWIEAMEAQACSTYCAIESLMAVQVQSLVCSS